MPARPADRARARHDERWTLVAAVLGSGIVFLDSTVVGVALPSIGRELPSIMFGVLEGQSYIYNAYLLSLSALLILAGALNDSFGRRRVFAIGLAGFGLTSLLCGLAPNIETLVLFRALQGAAGAILIPGSLALITVTFADEARARAFGVWAGASAATTILGPVIGGLLVDDLTWRAVFLINVPIVTLAIWVTTTCVRETRDGTAVSQLDWIGAAIVAVAVGGLSFGVIFGQQREWREPVAFLALGLGVVGTVALPFWMTRANEPLVPPDLFRSRNFSVINASTLLIYGALYVAFYYLPLWMVGTLGYTAAAVGLATIPTTFLLALFSSRSGELAERWGRRWFTSVGPVIMALGLLLLSRARTDGAAWTLQFNAPETYAPPVSYLTGILPGLLTFGLGLLIMVAPLTAVVMSSVDEEHSGVASAINNTISRVGPQLAGALIFVVVTGIFYADLERIAPGTPVSNAEFRQQVTPLNAPPASASASLEEAIQDASARAFEVVMWTSAGLLLLGGLVNALGIRDRPADEGQSTAEEGSRS